MLRYPLCFDEAYEEHLHYLKQTEGRHTNIAIVDDIRRDAELLAEAVEAYMSAHSISCVKAKLFASGEDSFATLSRRSMTSYFLTYI